MPPIKQPNLAALRAARAKAKAEAEAREKSAPLPTPDSLDGQVEIKDEKKGGKKDKGRENLDFFNQAPVAYARILKKEKEAKRRKRDSDDEDEDSDEEERERRKSTIADSDEEGDTPVKAKRGRGRPKKKEPVTRQRKRPTSRTPDSDSDSPIPTRRRRTSSTPPPLSPRNRLELTPPPPTRRRPVPTSSVSFPPTQTTRSTRGRPAKATLPHLHSQTPTTTQTTITLSSSPSPLRNATESTTTKPPNPITTIDSDSDLEIIAPPRIPTPPPQEGPNPQVEILISRPSARDSRIYLRRYRQTFKKVRLQWCADFGHSPADTVLVYKGRRVFDYTTCKGLMIPLPEDEDGGKVNIRFLAMREGEWEGRRGMVWDEEAEEGGGEKEDTSEEEGEMIGLLLKGRDKQEWKIAVNRNLTVARVIDKFKTEHKIDEDKEVTLLFDGEELEGDVKLADTEVEDDDCLDVVFS